MIYKREHLLVIQPIIFSIPNSREIPKLFTSHWTSTIMNTCSSKCNILKNQSAIAAPDGTTNTISKISTAIESTIVTFKEPSVTVGVVNDARSKDVTTTSAKFETCTRSNQWSHLLVPLLKAEVF